jgi:hypothetical protein
VIGLHHDQSGAEGLIARPVTALVKIAETFPDVFPGLPQGGVLTTILAEISSVAAIRRVIIDNVGHLFVS